MTGAGMYPRAYTRVHPAYCLTISGGLCLASPGKPWPGGSSCLLPSCPSAVQAVQINQSNSPRQDGQTTQVTPKIAKSLPHIIHNSNPNISYMHGRSCLSVFPLGMGPGGHLECFRLAAPVAAWLHVLAPQPLPITPPQRFRA